MPGEHPAFDNTVLACSKSPNQALAPPSCKIRPHLCVDTATALFGDSFKCISRLLISSKQGVGVRECEL